MNYNLRTRGFIITWKRKSGKNGIRGTNSFFSGFWMLFQITHNMLSQV